MPDSTRYTEVKGKEVNASFERARNLRQIIRVQFALRGSSPIQRDADLSSQFSERVMSILEACGTTEPELRRRIQLFASFNLLELELQKKPTNEDLKPFLAKAVGSGFAESLNDREIGSVDAANIQLRELLKKPEWKNVHGGHIAMTCLTLLSLYDVSVFNVSFPG